MDTETNHCEIVGLNSEGGEKVEDKNHLEEKADLTGDYGNAALLVLLYIFQGLLLGLCTAVPILLQNRGVSYQQQAFFTLVYYPFSLKVIWAPIVDACYIDKIGRRKTWIIPSQALIGISMILTSQHIDEWLGDEASSSPNIVALTAVFFAMRFCASVQDCAADGWALCLLKKRNIGHVSTCEMIGISSGWLVGYVILLVFESKEFCNSYIFSEPQNEGLISLGGFLKFWGITFLIITASIAIFKRENSEMMEKLQEHPDYGIKKAYPTLWKILKLKPVIKFSIFLLTVKISFAACDAVTSLKLLEYGVPKDKIALMAMPLLPIQIILPIIISRFITGKYPLNFYIRAFKFRLFMSVVLITYVYFTPWFISGHEISVYYYIGIFIIYLLYHIPFRAMSLSDTAFFAKISDPLIGGTYMTLLNTINNMGGKWSQTFALWLVDIISWKHCIRNEFSNSTLTLDGNKCASKEDKDVCIKNDGKCNTETDGYYIEALIFLIYGLIYYRFAKKTIEYLGKLPIHDSHVLSKDVEKLEANYDKELIVDNNNDNFIENK